MASSYSEAERVEIGKKLKQLLRERGVSQADVGVDIFKKTRQGGQSHVRRLLDGKWKKLNKVHIDLILDYIGATWPELENVKIKENPHNKAGVHESVLELIPELEQYTQMIDLAEEIDDTELINYIKLCMAKRIQLITTKMKPE